ncbi:hypothetical protein I552_9477 [Mycobacterium xenopi 3993]|nr:hypothetical protein I552_9477 [Mycobacterium xenopi 3993]
MPGLAGGHEDDFVELEQVGYLAGGDQVAVMDGIERPPITPSLRRRFCTICQLTGAGSWS